MNNDRPAWTPRGQFSPVVSYAFHAMFAVIKFKYCYFSLLCSLSFKVSLFIKSYLDLRDNTCILCNRRTEVQS